MKAFKLINTNENDCAFEEGSVPEMKPIDADYFFCATGVEPYQLAAHPAPRYQFVITLKGKLQFMVTDGSTFIIEPGVVLVAKDTLGEGHTWKILDGNEWHRIYIVPHKDAEDLFTADKTGAAQ